VYFYTIILYIILGGKRATDVSVYPGSTCPECAKNGTFILWILRQLLTQAERAQRGRMPVQWKSEVVVFKQAFYKFT